MSVARSSTPSAPARIWTPESAWIAPRVEATRLTVWSWASSSSRAADSFTMRTSSGERIVVIGDVEMCTSPAIAVAGGEDLRTGTVDTSVGSLSGGAVDIGLLKRGGEAADELVRLGVLAMRSVVRRQACRTVVWLRPPKARPIAGSVASVSSRERYIATWRAQATRALRSGELSASGEMPSRSQVAAWISSTVRRGRGATPSG